MKNQSETKKNGFEMGSRKKRMKILHKRKATVNRKQITHVVIVCCGFNFNGSRYHLILCTHIHSIGIDRCAGFICERVKIP